MRAMTTTRTREVLLAALVLGVAALAGGCANEQQAGAQTYAYGYDGAGQQYRYDGTDQPSAWQPAEPNAQEEAGDDAAASAPPPTRADGGETRYRETYV